MRTLITRIKRLALALCFVTPLVSWAAVDYTGTDYEPWSYSTVYVWRVPANSAITDLAFSTFAPVASNGTVGEAVTQTGNAYLSWAAGKAGYVAPGKVLCYDETGYKASIDSTFTPLSFGGIKVDALANETAGTPYTIVGTGTRYTDFGYNGHSTYFEFNKSFTINRSSATRCYGAVTIQVAKDATFKSQASLWAEVGGTVKLTGEGTVELPNGLYVNNNSTSTLDLSAATRPTITGNVTIYEGGAIALPAGTEPSAETPFTVCSGTLAVGANYNYVKIGDADPITATLTVSGGAITGIEPYPLERTFTSDYPTVVPAGAVFTFQGGTEDEPVVLDARTVNGTLKTEGNFSFTSYAASASSTLEVVSGKVTLNPGDNWLQGTLTVEAGATFVNARGTDAVNYNGTFTANIYGTLDMGATRWSLGSNNTLNFHEGCTVTGSGQGGNGALDWIENATANLNVTGAVTIDAPIKIRGTATVNVTVDSDAKDGLTLGTTIGVGTIVKKGAGLIKFTTNPDYAITCQNGSFTFGGDATPTITYPALPTTSTSMWYAKQTNWKGTVVINAQTSVNGSVPLATWGTANSKIVLKGLSGSSCYFGQNVDTEVQANVQIDGNVTFNNGWSGKQYILDKVTGTDADVTLSLNTASGMTSMNYTIQTLDFAGTIALVGGSTKAEGCNYQFTIGNIVKAETPLPGTKIVKLTRTVGTGCTDTITVNLDSTTLNGEAANLVLKDDGIYVAESTIDVTVPVVDNTVVTVTVGGETVSPKTEGGNVYAVAPGSVVTVTYTAAEGYRLPDGVQSVYNVTADEDTSVEVSEDLVSELLVAKVRNTASSQDDEYTTLAAAVAATKDGNHNPMVTLMANVDEAEVTVDSAIMLLGNKYTISSDVTIAAGGQLQVMQVMLAGKLTIEENGIYVTGGGELSELVTKDGAKIELTTLSDTEEPLSVTTLSVAGELTIISSWGMAVRDTYYKALSYVTANADIAEGATVDSVNEWSAKVEEEGDKTVVYLAITKVAVVDGVYYDTAQEAVDAAVASGEPAQFLVQPGTVTLGAGETLTVTGAFLPTVELEDGLTTPPYSLETTPYSEVTGLTIYTVLKEVSVVPAEIELYYNCTSTVSVVGYDPGSTFYWLEETIDGEPTVGSTISFSGTIKPLSISIGRKTDTVKFYSNNTNGTWHLTALVTNNNEQVATPVVSVTVKDVAAVVGGVEYSRAQFADAIAAAIANDEVLGLYLSAPNATLAVGETLRVKVLATRNVVNLPTVTGPEGTAGTAYVVNKVKDPSTGITTFSLTEEEPSVMFTDGVTTEYYPANFKATKAGTYKLLKNISRSQLSVGTTGVVLDLNGKTFTSTATGTTAAISVSTTIGSASLTITGEGSIVAPNYSAVQAGKNGSVAIESGSLSGKTVIVYTANGGTATISGGTFAMVSGSASTMLNCKDDNRGTIAVTGGTFTGFDPANTSDGNMVSNGYAATETSTGVWTVAKSGIDPTDPTSTQEVTVDTSLTAEEQEAAAIEAATVTVPDGVSGVDAPTYKTYFTYSATPTETAGTYTVAITGLADEVTETADGNALAALEAATAGGTLSAEVAVKPGLYYGTVAGADVTTLKAPAGTLNTTGKLDLSGVTKPSTGEAFFIKIKVGTTAFAAEE